MRNPRRISHRLRLPDSTLHARPRRWTVQFDDPPGPSPARITFPIWDGQDEVLIDLSNELKGRVSEVRAGGVYSAAYTDETYAVLLFALGGVAGGILGAVGEDIWNAVKRACARVLRRRGAKRNVIEVTLSFENADVLLHFENRNASRVPAVLDEADAILLELQQAMQNSESPLAAAKTVELRHLSGRSEVRCVLHSFRKGEMVLKRLRKLPRRTRRARGKGNKPTTAEQSQ